MFATRRFSRTVVANVALAGVGAYTLSQRNQYFSARCDATPAGWPFDTKGLPERVRPAIPGFENKCALTLVGTGMRRKNLYLVELDIYKVGVVLSPLALQRAQAWTEADKSSRKNLTGYILRREPQDDKEDSHNPIRAGIILRLVRTVTKQQFIDAFNVAFQGVDTTAFKQFSEILSHSIGENLQANEEFAFYFLSNGSVVTTKNNKFDANIASSVISHPEIVTRLMDIYVDSEKTVSKELFTCVEKNVVNVSTGDACSLTPATKSDCQSCKK